ncbi:exodeoxyribonuclease V subunit gamma [Neisseria chenwenguii]|uniref:exodeoxyribonuclease V subunit gamma n=1 Tax=Neisseria chenwenguii TaxID=1853278 RepID=UPI000F4E9AAE|nr:exodeoxyribonuclease V subunit gamma [Neisseria chenwenguii]ROV56091.1 exodeoxyribonuclease V subunit gamma [Neisseria chenwenguii]
MFYLYQSDRLEYLAALFCRIRREQPLAGALRAEEIVVQSQGMRRYLGAFLARETGVAANLKFSLPAGLTWRLMREFIAGIPALSPFAPEVMRWRLLDLFRSSRFQTASEFAGARSALQGYLNSGGAADYRLAGQLADVFDQYLVYRPQWIDAWQAGKTLDLGDAEGWQAQLWHYLDDGRQSAPHRVALWETLLSRLSADKLPERFFVFGISTMAPMYLQLLQKLSEHCDVIMLALNPSSRYWGDVIEPAQILKGADDADLNLSGHPFLASLGKQGRDFFDFLNEIELEESRVFDEDSQPDTLLHRLQHDIRTLAMPSENVPTNAEKMLGDGSVRVVSAHSPLRELQILKDRILHILAEHPTWQPHDIAVLTPNIEPYSPFIEAVFGQAQAGAQALPYSVSDVRLSRRQPLFYALEQVLDLLESRFEVDKVLMLLESPPVLARFGLTADDLPLLHDTVAALKVHWGLDKTMRGGSDGLFTWQQALERLVLGWMLPEGQNPLWHGISAWHGDVNRLDTFARFAAFVRTLADTARLWAQNADTAGWTARARGLVEALFAPDDADQYALQQFEQALAQWNQEAALAGFTGELPPPTALRHLRRFLGSESDAGFLRGGITFCSMVPMRSLPFKVLCLLGLNDGDFPRNTKAAEFDLIARHPQKGDRARRDDDRYLFLEALISAREILYLSYIGRDIRNDAELAPSALLGALIDTVAAMTGTRSRDLLETWIVQHPLQPFSRRYFIPSETRPHGQISDGLSSTRRDYAAALAQTPESPKAFFRQPLQENQPAAAVGQNELIAFWKNPVKSWLHQTLGWREPYRDAVWESAEPFEPEAAGTAAAAYLDARRRKQNFDDVAVRLAAESLVPAGELGKLWQARFQADAKHIDQTLLDGPKHPPHAYELTFVQDFGDQTLQGSLTDVYQRGQILFAEKTPNAPETLAVYLKHLIFCAVRPSESESAQTWLVLPDQTQHYPEIPQIAARAMLADWLAYYSRGQTRPLPFFAKTCLEAAKKYLKEKTDENKKAAALKAAADAYKGNKINKGQGSYTDTALVFGNDETAPYETDLFWELLEKLLLPLLAALQEKEEDGEAV